MESLIKEFDRTKEGWLQNFQKCAFLDEKTHSTALVEAEGIFDGILLEQEQRQDGVVHSHFSR